MYSIFSYIQHYNYSYVLKIKIKTYYQNSNTKFKLLSRIKTPESNDWNFIDTSTLRPLNTSYCKWVCRNKFEFSQVWLPNLVPTILLTFPLPVKGGGYACTKSSRLGMQVALHFSKDSKDFSQSTIKWVWMPYLRHLTVFIKFYFKLLLHIIK